MKEKSIEENWNILGKDYLNSMLRILQRFLNLDYDMEYLQELKKAAEVKSIADKTNNTWKWAIEKLS
jgi:hypothetical protein